MNFFDWEADRKERILCQEDNGKIVTYKEADVFTKQMKAVMKERSLMFLLCENSSGSLLFYLSALKNKAVPLLLDSRIEGTKLKRLDEIYRPDFIAAPKYKKIEGVPAENIWQEYNYCLYERREKEKKEIHPDLALLLTTSGSTGSPRLVRQSRKNISSNAAAIAGYLNLGRDERPITTLPMNYTYGLSVINSHVLTGAKVLLTDHSVIEKEFWEFAKKEKATSMAGVPYTYEILDRLNIYSMDLPYMRTLTQAGGKLQEDLQQKFASYAKKQGKRFFIMYGQTEATARMAYLPWEYALEKRGSVGIPIPGGKFQLEDDGGEEIRKAGITGELIYYGPNVTMGYAECLEDLGKGDEHHGRLVTGDLAQRDKDGFYYIQGRKKRFLKIFGNRISLDEVEVLLKQKFHGEEFACTGEDDCLKIFTVCQNREILLEIIPFLEEKLQINGRAFLLVPVDEIPKTEAGKIRYGKLSEKEG